MKSKKLKKEIEMSKEKKILVIGLLVACAIGLTLLIIFAPLPGVGSSAPLFKNYPGVGF